MNTPIIGRNFGNFSRVLGPWDDIFPTDLTLPDCQFGVGIGTTITGGQKGAIITSITIEPPFNVVGSLAVQNWRVVVVRGGPPASLYEYQRALRGWPRTGDSDQKETVLWSKMLAKKIAADNFAATFMNEHFPFPDYCGPSVGPGEEMTVFMVGMFNELVSAYGVNNQTYTSLSVYGIYGSAPGSSDTDFSGRSIPRGRIGG